MISNLCREALAALRAKEEYQRRHMAGETEQAKRELAKLAEVRARREAARLKREAGITNGKQPYFTLRLVTYCCNENSYFFFVDMFFSMLGRGA